MRRPQVVIFEADGRLAAQLASLAEAKKWVIRESRQVEPCLRLVSGIGPSVLVIRLGPDAESELDLIARATALPSELRVVVVGDGPPPLTALAWDLGASYVLTSGMPSDLLPRVVAGLMGQR